MDTEYPALSLLLFRAFLISANLCPKIAIRPVSYPIRKFSSQVNSLSCHTSSFPIMSIPHIVQSFPITTTLKSISYVINPNFTQGMYCLVLSDTAWNLILHICRWHGQYRKNLISPRKFGMRGKKDFKKTEKSPTIEIQLLQSLNFGLR